MRHFYRYLSSIHFNFLILHGYLAVIIFLSYDVREIIFVGDIKIKFMEMQIRNKHKASLFFIYTCSIGAQILSWKRNLLQFFKFY